MKWVKASGYRIKSIDEKKFIVPVQKKIRHTSPARGCQAYNVDEYRQDAILSFLNAWCEEGALEFTKKFGPLGLYFYYKKGMNEHILLKAYTKPLEEVYWASRGELHKKWSLDCPLMNDALDWLDYREPVEAIIDEAEIFSVYHAKLKEGKKPDLMTLPAEIGFLDGKPYWVPNATTLIEYLYAWLPVLLSRGLTIKQCENETCNKFFIGTGKLKHCPDKCKNAQNQREYRQRNRIIDLLNEGKSLEEACKDIDMAKVQAWLKSCKNFMDRDEKLKQVIEVCRVKSEDS